MTRQLFQILAATIVTAGLLILAVAQLPIIGQATVLKGTYNFRLLQTGTSEIPRTFAIQSDIYGT